MAARARSLSAASSCTLFDTDDVPQHVFEDVVIDLTGDHQSRSLLKDGEVELERLHSRGQTFSKNDIIEVRGAQLGSYSVEFLQVQIIAETHSKPPILRGLPMVRTRNLSGKLQKKQNEVFFLRFIERTADEDDLDHRPMYLDVGLESILRKRSLIITNAPWPEHSFSPLCAPLNEGIEEKKRRQRRAERNGILACRWKLTVYYTTQGRQTRTVEEVLERLLSGDVQEATYRLPDGALRNRWHGIYTRGGAWNGGRLVPVDLEAVPQAPHSRAVGQKYTFFDAFSGAGGVSRGAKAAGFKVQYAVDKEQQVWDTYRRNFPRATLYKTCIYGFLKQAVRDHIRVDVLHLSPPCQYFSPAHTHESAHDMDNIAAQFGCGELIKKTRPRVITLEQTFGITYNRHLPYFGALIGQMTQHGYSVRWRVVRLCAWGAAQTRKRLVVIAASPGHSLPPFPKSTHSEIGGRGLKPFTTIGQAISDIPRGHDLHDVRRARRFQPARAPYHPHKLAGTITTSCAQLYHPSGKRELTLRELACLQGFPHDHRFVGSQTSIRTQIGNAFPPNTVAVLYKHLHLWLLKEDGMVPHRPPVGQVLIVDID